MILKYKNVFKAQLANLYPHTFLPISSVISPGRPHKQTTIMKYHIRSDTENGTYIYLGPYNVLKH